MSDVKCPVCEHYSHGECAAIVRARALAEVIAEVEGMHPSIDAAQAATDLRQSYASDLAWLNAESEEESDT